MLPRILLLTLVLTRSAAAADWPQWRGPARDGIAEAFEAPANWPERLNKGWSIEVGEGHASPVVVGETVYQFSREGGDEVVRGLRLRDGSEIWRAQYPAPYTVNSAATRHGAGPKATPTLADGKLYTFGISGILSCFNAADGKLLWRKEYSKDYAETSPLYGAAMSPAVVDGRVFAHVGGPGKGALLALDASTGSVLWRWDEDGPGYASPIVATLSGVRQVITQTEKFVLGLDFQSGAELWKIPFTTPYDQNSVTPVLLGDVLFYSGTRQPTVAVRIAKTADGWTTRPVWSNAEIPMYMSTPAVSSDLLLGLTQRNSGALFAADARTGKLLWMGPPRQGDNAALILSDDLLLAVTTEAELIVAKPSADGLNVVKTYDVAESNVWAHPAAAGPFILIKDKTKLTRWSVR